MCCTWHRITPFCSTGCWLTSWKNPWQERTWQTRSWTWSSSSPLKQRRQIIVSWGAASSSRGKNLLSLGTAETPRKVLWAVLWSTSTRRRQNKKDTAASSAQSFHNRRVWSTQCVRSGWEMCVFSVWRREMAERSHCYLQLLYKKRWSQTLFRSAQ